MNESLKNTLNVNERIKNFWKSNKEKFKEKLYCYIKL